MKIDVDESGNIRFSDVFNSIVIKTEIGEFGICQRDGGLEVIHKGKTVFSQYVSTSVSAFPVNVTMSAIETES